MILGAAAGCAGADGKDGEDGIMKKALLVSRAKFRMASVNFEQLLDREVLNA